MVLATAAAAAVVLVVVVAAAVLRVKPCPVPFRPSQILHD